MTAPGTAPRASSRLPPTVLLPRDGRQPLLLDELESLLRRRLRAVALFALVSFTLSGLLGGVFRMWAFRSDERALVGLCISTSLLALFVALLFSRWPKTLERLRVLELALFGTVAAQMALGMYGVFRDGIPPELHFPGTKQMLYFLVSDHRTLRWFALIVIYGTVIPNTGRHCAWLVLGMAAAPLVVLVLLGVEDEDFRARLWKGLFWNMLFWMGTAAATALYGARKLSALRQAAFEARQMGQYQLERLLGHGGAGEVYLARHQRLHRPCAIKLIRPEKAGDASALLRFEREVQVMAELTHPNCVEIYDYGRADDGSFFYAMEYLPGLTFRELVDKHGPQPAPRVLQLLRQVCAALQVAHARGLVHRDVKPSNVLVCFRDGIGDLAKLFDFGFVQVEAWMNAGGAHATQEGKIVGTPLFMSPEQIVGKGRLDGRSDLYSLGATGYFLLTGQPPFMRENVIDVFSAHLHEPPPPLTRLNDDVPADLQEVVLHCLEKLPENRFPDAAALDRALAACQDAGRWNAERALDWWGKYHSDLAEPITPQRGLGPQPQ